jgi:hypothetical protein
MIELAIQIFSIVIEVLFPVSRTFEKDSIDRHAQWLTDPVNGFAVPPDQMRLRQGDVVFANDLSVQLFGGNGHFSLDAQKASFSAKNVRGRADGELLRQVSGRFLGHFAREKCTVAVSANAFAKAESKAVREEYVHRFRFDPRITKPGANSLNRLRFISFCLSFLRCRTLLLLRPIL